jgi:hypothetical protein
LAGYPIEIPAGILDDVSSIFSTLKDIEYPDFAIVHNNGMNLPKGEYNFNSTVKIGVYRWSILATVSTSGSSYRYHSISSMNEQIIFHPGNLGGGSGISIEKSKIELTHSHHLKAVLFKKV